MNIKEMEMEWGKFPDEDRVIDENGTPAWGQSLFKATMNQLINLMDAEEASTGGKK